MCIDVRIVLARGIIFQWTVASLSLTEERRTMKQEQFSAHDGELSLALLEVFLLQQK
jgi:hypothetical protein